MIRISTKYLIGTNFCVRLVGAVLRQLSTPPPSISPGTGPLVLAADRLDDVDEQGARARLEVV